MDNPALLSEMIKRAATENAAMVDPVGRTDTPGQDSGPGKAAVLAFLAGLGADVGTTAYGAHKGLTKEANPLLKWAGDKGAAPATAAMGAGTLLISHFLGKKHPGLSKALLYGMGGAHGAAALSNLSQIGKSKQALADAGKPAAVDNSKPPRPGMVQLSDGTWIDPAYFPGLGGY